MSLVAHPTKSMIIDNQFIDQIGFPSHHVAMNFDNNDPFLQRCQMIRVINLVSQATIFPWILTTMAFHYKDIK